MSEQEKKRQKKKKSMINLIPKLSQKISEITRFSLWPPSSPGLNPP